LVGNPAYPDIIADYRKTFAKLHTLPCDVLLAAHGWDFDLEGKMKRAGATPNPFVDSAACKEYIDTSEKAIEAKIREQQAAAKKP
jgi:metallo-beta-lactamase class B